MSDRGVSGSFAWDPAPLTARGPSLTLTQTMGASATGGADALLGRETPAGLAVNDTGDDLKRRRLEVKLGYGVAAFGGRFTATPEAGLGLSDTGRDLRLGWRLTPAARGHSGFEVNLEATRREAAGDDAAPEHGVRLEMTARW